jgi:hypothetical protein
MHFLSFRTILDIADKFKLQEFRCISLVYPRVPMRRNMKLSQLHNRKSFGKVANSNEMHYEVMTRSNTSEPDRRRFPSITGQD